MMPFQFLKFSESVRGEPIVLVDDFVPGNLIHKALSGTTAIDRVYLYLVNPYVSVSHTVGISIGGNATQNRIANFYTQPIGYRVCVMAGLPIQNGVEIRGWTPTSNIPEGILAFGYVVRMTL